VTHKAFFGKELELMLSGKKPMAAFYKVVGERFDETGGQSFWEHVETGEIEKSRFFIRNEGQPFTMMYTVYVLPRERWRVSMYKALKKSGQTVWCKTMGDLEYRLLNY
jgi:hypothetical protein